MTSVTNMLKNTGVLNEDSPNYNISTWDLASLTACSYYFDVNADPAKLCHPPRMLELGCYSTCCETSVARSDYSAARSITGLVGSWIEVACDSGYSHVTNTDILTCNNSTGIYDGWEQFNCTGHTTSYIESPSM